MSAVNGSNGHVEYETDPFREAVEDALKKRATHDQLAMLEADPELHLLVLGELKRDVESQFAVKTADHEANRTVCLALGPAGREQWAQCERDHQSWKAGAIRFKATVENAIARLKLEVKRDHNARQDAMFGARVAELERRVGELAAAVEAGR